MPTNLGEPNGRAPRPHLYFKTDRIYSRVKRNLDDLPIDIHQRNLYRNRHLNFAKTNLSCATSEKI